MDDRKYNNNDNAVEFLQPHELSDGYPKIFMNHATKEATAAIHMTKERIKSSHFANQIYGQLAEVDAVSKSAQQSKESNPELPAWTEISPPTGRIRYKSTNNPGKYPRSILSAIGKNKERFGNKQGAENAGKYSGQKLLSTESIRYKI